MVKKHFWFFLSVLILFSNFHFFSTLNQDTTQDWKTKKSSFRYSLNVIETFSNIQSIGFQIDLLFRYTGNYLNNNTEFEIQTHTRLINYAGTESSNGFENLNTRLMNINLTNSINMKLVMDYLGFSSNNIYNPFVIPINSIQTKHSVTIWTYNHNFSGSVLYKWFGIQRNASIYQFHSLNNNIIDKGIYDNEFGILFYAEFYIEGSSSTFNASIRLLDTSLNIPKGEVPLLNYLVALMICLVIPLTFISVYYVKKFKTKKIDSGGLK